MPRLTKVFVKNFNKRLLGSEIQTAFGEHSISYAGFHDLDRYRVEPNATTVVIGRTIIGGVPIADEAEPGELRMFLQTDPGTALDTLLTNHDATTQSDSELIDLETEADITTVALALRSANPFRNNEDAVRAVARLVLKQQ